MNVGTAGDATNPSDQDVATLGERIWLATEMACDPVWNAYLDRLGVQPPLQTVGAILASTRGRFGPDAQTAALRIAARVSDETVLRLTERLIQARDAQAVLRTSRAEFLRSLVTLAAESEGPPSPAPIAS